MLLGGLTLAVGACDAQLDDQETAAQQSALEALPTSTFAMQRADELRARFQLRDVTHDESHVTSVRGRPILGGVHMRPVLAAGIASAFEVAPGALAKSHVRARLPSDAIRAARTPAVVDLPRRANDAVVLEDQRSHMTVRFALQGAEDADVTVAGGYAIYRSALHGADLIHRVSAEGTEDFVAFETRPANEELVYDVDVSRVRGLRLVERTLELLDETGSPTLRIAPPYVVDANNQHHEATISVEGCAYDESPAPPWGRDLTPIGASHCTVRIAWSNVAYPALVDPVWSTTGKMVVARKGHRAVALATNKVLLVGGSPYANPKSAELFDETANGGAGAFAVTGSTIEAHDTGSSSATSFTATRLSSGNVLVAGGGAIDYIGKCQQLAVAEVYNASTGRFVATGSMVSPRLEASATLLPSGKVLVAGGWSTGCVTPPSAEVFDPTANGGVGAFSATGPLGAGREGHTTTVLKSGKVLIAGGFNNWNPEPTAEVFDPLANGVGAVIATVAMPTRWAHAAELLPSGRVLLAGGANTDFVFTKADVYDPAANGGAGAVVPAGDISVNRIGVRTAVLPSGRVILIGGTSPGTPSGVAGATTVEFYDPALGTFYCGPAMSAPRTAFQSTPLASGRWLITGGATGSPNFTGFKGDAEIFDGVKALEESTCAPPGAVEPPPSPPDGGTTGGDDAGSGSGAGGAGGGGASGGGGSSPTPSGDAAPDSSGDADPKCSIGAVGAGHSGSPRALVALMAVAVATALSRCAGERRKR